MVNVDMMSTFKINYLTLHLTLTWHSHLRHLPSIYPSEQEMGILSVFIHVGGKSPIHINVCIMAPTSKPPAALTGIPESTQVCVSCVLSRSPLCHCLALAFSFCYPLFMRVFNRHNLMDISAGSSPCENGIVDAEETSSCGHDVDLHHQGLAHHQV